MNFKQNSLFTRNTGFDEEQADVQGGVLAVWGSPSSGKTTVSVKLADYLARKKKNVLLIFADMTTPPLPCICAAGDLEGEKSLGSILAATHVTENLIKKNCMFYRKNDYLSMVGMLKGENVFTYPPYDQTQAAELIEQAREVVPFVIIDCGSTIASDVLSAVALMEADTVLRLVNCDLKSISYMCDRLILDTCGYFINSCPNQEFCKEIHPFLIPIQMGEKDAGEVLSVSRDVSEQYFREEDEAATMAEIGMM